MKVVDHRPHAWFLLEHEGQLYLDAYCSLSFLDYSVLIELNAAETEAYHAGGQSFLDKLSSDINDSAPAARGSKSPFKGRNLALGDAPEATLSHAAIMAWRAAGS